MKKSNKGFTLVELIVVIAIIGILAAILVPAMIGYITDSKLSSANSSAKQVYTAINNYCQKIIVSEQAIGTNGGEKFSNDWPIMAKDASNNKFKDVDSPFVPDKDVAADNPYTNNNPDSWAPWITSAVSLSMGEEAVGTYYNAKFKNGFPYACIWKKSETDTYVGGYPEQADKKNWTLEDAAGSSTLAGGGSGGTGDEAGGE